ncbi:glycoside hydrolase family 3 C-terminal domain-containing protein [Schaalia sp. lx-100]|uniref:glycoside hydrolase family 3 C-terminal domain-containing protein n=1 Tax=Schaalia sp. lx-100 TaxID=2899081 RepID=UPI001E355F73|nr:glycoside hydrolase family 3 C-terminal domain-containing protein [Schaalia sp. lx-100]
MKATAETLTLIEAAALLSGTSEWDSRALPKRGIPSFVMSDGPHGVRRQLGSGDHLGIAAAEPATCFPTAATVAHSWDPKLAESMGKALGAEARSLGVDVLLGPGLNIARSPLCGRNFEYYSEDPYLSGKMAAGMVRGIQSQGVAATPKHFAVNSQELRRQASDSVLDERTMREIYLTAFEIIVRESHPRALMSSYNKINGTYAHENAHLLTDILRNEWGFDGMVVSDWGGSNSASAAVRAGGSLEMPAPGLHSVREILAAVEAGEISEADVRARAAEVIAIARSAHSHEERPTYNREAHHELARQVARESIVLMRNNGILPLVSGTRVAIIGDMAQNPRYQGSGSSQINPTQLESLCDTATNADVHVVGYAQGYDRLGKPRPDLISEACELAARADVVVLALGLDELSESEGLDRQHLQIPQVQRTLLEALASINDRIVVVLSAGSVVETSWLTFTQALVHTCLSGQAGASAAWDILMGHAEPSGRLSQTWPLRLEDHPTRGFVPSHEPFSVYREGPYVGYRYFDTAEVPVAFPFGYGLSYATWEYSDIVLASEGVRFTVTNTSDRAGVCVPQMYVARPGKVWGPRRELKGFAKVRLEAGESTEVFIPFDQYTFRHFDRAHHKWQVENGRWTVSIGNNIADLLLNATWDVASQDDNSGESYEAIPVPYQTGHVRDLSDADVAKLLGYPVPQHQKATVLTVNDPLSDMVYSRSWVARCAGRMLEKKKAQADATGKPDLNILFLTNMPFRAMGKMSKGLISTQAVDAIVECVNGRTFRGLGHLIREIVRTRRQNRQTQRAIDEAVTCNEVGHASAAS